MDLREIQQEIRTYMDGTNTVIALDHETPWMFRAQAVQLALMNAYADAECLLRPSERCSSRGARRSGHECCEDEVCVVGCCKPILRTSYRCASDDDCAQDERCVGGICKPRAGSRLLRCRDDDDCAQDEKCVGGICVPRPFDLVFIPTGGSGASESGLPAVSGYLERISVKLLAALENDPRRIGDVRDVLMYLRAGCMPTTGSCEGDDDCDEGEVCVNGVCISVPFLIGGAPI